MTEQKHNLPSESTRHISTLHEWDKNPRSITKEGFDRLKRQLQTNKDRYGKYLFKPLLINEDGVVLGGNMRLKALKELGVEDIDVSVVPTRNEQEMVDIALKDNDSAGKTEKDELLALIENFPDLKLDDYAVHFDIPETLTDFMEQFKEIEEDEVPDVSNEPAVSEYGKVYQLGRHRLMCGDATKIEDVEKLMNGQKADMVFTDPPYGMDLDTDFSKMPRGGNTYGRVIGDDKDFDANTIMEVAKVDKYYIWGADWFYTTLPKGFSPIVWDKQPQEGEAGPQNHFELCWAFPKEKRRIIRRLWTGYTATEKNEKRVHPTQKPIEVCAAIIGKGDGTVLDLFGGSGSTLIACEQLDRTAYLMEISPAYCDVIRKRYAKFIGKEDSWQTETPLIQA